MSSQKTIQDLIAQSKTRKAIDALLALTRSLDEDLYQEVLLQSAKYEQYKKDERNELLDFKSQEIRLSRINNALFEIAQKLPDMEVPSIERITGGTPLQKGSVSKRLSIVVAWIVAALVFTGLGGIFFARVHPMKPKNELGPDQHSAEMVTGTSPDHSGQALALKKTPNTRFTVKDSVKSKSVSIGPTKIAGIAYLVEEDPYNLYEDVKASVSGAFAQRGIKTKTLGHLKAEEFKQLFETGLPSGFKADENMDWIILCKYKLTQQKAQSAVFGQEVNTDRQLLEIKVFNAKQLKLLQTMHASGIKTVKSLQGDDLEKIANENRNNLKAGIKQLNLNLN